jgi:ElaB/YqjD/DUF883 family membrane-anchored ribosome-binding protein
MGQGTEEQLTIREREIEETRARLSADTDELGDKLSPQRIVQRRKDAARDTLGSVRDRVMGKASSMGDSVTSTGESVSGGASAAASSVQSRTQGNPLAAGLVAFGAGMVISAMFPASEKEKELGQTAVEKSQPLVDEAKSVGQEMGDNLKQSAQQAAEDVKSTAQESADTLKQEGQSSAQSVSEEARSD